VTTLRRPRQIAGGRAIELCEKEGLPGTSSFEHRPESRRGSCWLRSE